MFDDIKKVDSCEGNVSKFIYSKEDAVAESVLYKYPTYSERTVICCSTQSGCPVGCRFCGAGDYFVRNLTSKEIAHQVEHSMSQTGLGWTEINKLQIMFMSMGEPLLNIKELVPAITQLNAKYPNAALLVSTIGPKVDFEPFMELASTIDKVGLQFSVHEPTDDARNKLIPLKGKLSLLDIAEKGEEFFIRTGRKPFFNYCANDHNSGEEDAKKLRALFNPTIWECTISVVCERNDGLPAKNEHQLNLANTFSSFMVQEGFNVRVFDPAGQDDIGGGCGQLWFVQDWMKNNPDKAKPSVGNGLPTVHVPVVNV
jgi:23S rRNA (adenine2503-C2)-methyltransferase